MSFWIAAWVFVFALVAAVAALLGGESWRDELPMVALMVAAMAASGWIMFG